MHADVPVMSAATVEIDASSSEIPSAILSARCPQAAFLYRDQPTPGQVIRPTHRTHEPARPLFGVPALAGPSNHPHRLPDRLEPGLLARTFNVRCSKPGLVELVALRRVAPATMRAQRKP
jgi:hypothetical protein